MIHKLIPWRGKTYHAVELFIFPYMENEEYVTVATEELEEELLAEMKNGNSEAFDLDEQIAYYITSDEIKFPEGKIKEIVENAISE